MVLFPSLVNGKVANGGRENDRGNFHSRAVGISGPPRAHPLLYRSNERYGNVMYLFCLR